MSRRSMTRSTRSPRSRRSRRNKIDLIAEEDRDALLADLVKRLRWGKKPWFAVSAATGEGCDVVTKKAMAFITAEKREAAESNE